MKALENQFFHYINNTYFLGIPIDHFIHVVVCFVLYVVFRSGFKLKVFWCFFFIFWIGMWKVWYSWGAMLANGRFENPIMKMMDNGIGAILGYYFCRWKSRITRRIN